MKSVQCQACSREYDHDGDHVTCPACDGLLDLTYDLHQIGSQIDTGQLARRREYSVWRYAEFLPVDSGNAISMGEGFTPLVKANKLGQHLGVPNLYLKLDFTCPTGSFKDRGSTVMLSKAKQVSRQVVIDSSGNAAASVSSYSAKAGLRCYVFSPSYASVAKLVQSLAYGAVVFAVKGTRYETYETAKDAYRHFGWYYCGFQTNPYAIEGLKTVAFEVCEQLNWQPPDHISIPIGSGGNLIGCWKGLKELHQLEWIPRLPSLAGVQAIGCAPIVNAFNKGSNQIVPCQKPDTIAEGLMISHPLRGKQVLQALSETKGSAVMVSDPDILHASKLLAKYEGIFVEPSAAISLANIQKLAEKDYLTREEKVVCVLTGSGLKTREAYSEIVPKLRYIEPGIQALKPLISHTEN